MSSLTAVCCSAGAILEICNKDGEIPYDIAMRHGLEDLAEYLEPESETIEVSSNKGGQVRQPHGESTKPPTKKTRWITPLVFIHSVYVQTGYCLGLVGFTSRCLQRSQLVRRQNKLLTEEKVHLVDQTVSLCLLCICESLLQSLHPPYLDPLYGEKGKPQERESRVELDFLTPRMAADKAKAVVAQSESVLSTMQF